MKNRIVALLTAAALFSGTGLLTVQAAEPAASFNSSLLLDGKTETACRVKSGDTVTLNASGGIALGVTQTLKEPAVLKYTVSVSADQKEWTLCADYRNSTIQSQSFFNKLDVQGGYVRIEYFDCDAQVAEVSLSMASDQSKEDEKNKEKRTALFEKAFADTDGNTVEYQAETLYRLGIISGNEQKLFNPTLEVTRADFAVMLFGLMQYKKISDNNLNFHDVPAGHYAFEEIKALANNGIVVGGSGSNFRPADPVTFEEAAIMAARCMGYTFRLEPNAPGTDYMSVCRRENILWNVDGAEAVTMADAAALLYKMLLSCPYELTGIREDESQYQKDGEKTLLEKKFGLKQYEGVVTGDGKTKINRPADNRGDLEGQLELDGVSYKLAEGFDFNGDYVGSRVVYFVPAERAEDQTLRFAYLLDQDKRMHTISGKDAGYGDGRITDSSQGKDRRYSVAKGAPVFLNGVYYKQFEQCGAELIEEADKVVLVSGGDEGVYNAVRIYQYENEFVNYVDSRNLTVVTTAGHKYDLRETAEELVQLTGNTVEELKNGDVLSVFRSRNTTGVPFARITAGGEKLENASVTQLNDDSVVIGGKEYETKGQVTLAPGLRYTIWTDAWGKIAKAEAQTTESGQLFAYVVAMDYDGFGGSGSMLIVDMDAKSMVLDIKGKVSVRNAGTIPGEKSSSKRMDAEELYGLMLDDTGSFESRIVGYTVRDEKTLASITLPVDGEDFGNFSRDYVADNARYKWAVQEFDYRYKVTKDTKMLIVPDDKFQTNKYYTTYAFNGDDGYKIEVYDSDEYRNSSFILVKGISGSYVFADELFLVTGVYTTITDDGEEKGVIEGYMRGNLTEVVEGDVGLFKDVKIGDFLNIDYNPSGEAMKFRTVTPTNLGQHDEDRLFNKYTTVQKVMGNSFFDGERWYDFNETHIYEVDTEKKEVKKIGMSEIEIGEEIFLRVGNYKLTELVVTR